MLSVVLFHFQSFCRKGAENRLFSKSGFSAKAVYESCASVVAWTVLVLLVLVHTVQVCFHEIMGFLPAQDSLFGPEL